METDVWRQTTKHNHAQFMMQSTDPLSTPLRFMSCNSQSSCNFFLTKKDRSRSSCQHSFINMHERIFILAMRAGATVMLEAMNIQIWKQTTITLHMRIFGTTTVVCYHTYWCIHASIFATPERPKSYITPRSAITQLVTGYLSQRSFLRSSLPPRWLVEGTQAAFFF